MSRWRPESVGKQLREELSDLIQNRLKDPRLGFVTITDVRMTPDLREARVYASVLGEDARVAETMSALEHAVPFLRRELGRRVRLRITPEIEFINDRSIEQGARINKLLDQLDP